MAGGRALRVHVVAIDQRIQQAVEHQVLRHEQLEPVPGDEQVLHRAAHALPGRMRHPGLLAGVERLARVAVELQADAREVLRDAQAVHGRVDEGLRDRRAVAVAAAVAVVHVGAPLVVAQRHQHLLQRLAHAGIGLRQQLALVGELELPVGALLLARARHRVDAVIEMARVLERIPVGHDDRGAALVVELVLRIPQRPVVEVGRGLHVQRGFLVARGRLVAEPPRHVREGLADRPDVRGLDVDLHGGVSLGCLFGKNGEWARQCSMPGAPKRHFMRSKSRRAPSSVVRWRTSWRVQNSRNWSNSSTSSTASSGSPMANSNSTKRASRVPVTRTKQGWPVIPA
eukprot:Opistho-1_new@26965